jgi:hypothetical protein
MKSNVIELPRAVPPPSPPQSGLRARLGLVVRTLIELVWWLLDRLAAVFGYSRPGRAAFERWLHPAGRSFFDDVARRPGGRPGRLIDFEAARATREARRR